MSKQGKVLVAMLNKFMVGKETIKDTLSLKRSKDIDPPTEEMKIEHCNKYPCVECPLLNSCDIIADISSGLI